MTLPWKEALHVFGSEQQQNSSPQYLPFISQAQWVKPFPNPMCPPTADKGSVEQPQGKDPVQAQSAR